MISTFEIIQREYEDLLDNGYIMTIEDVTNIYKKIIYEKGNVKLILECELMPQTIEFEIIVKDSNTLYSICECKGRKTDYYNNLHTINVIHQSIFQYEGEMWSEASFQESKEKIYSKEFSLTRKHKIFIELLSLYKQLLLTALVNINLDKE